MKTHNNKIEEKKCPMGERLEDCPFYKAGTYVPQESQEKPCMEVHPTSSYSSNCAKCQRIRKEIYSTPEQEPEFVPMAYGEGISKVRQILAQYLPEWKNKMLCDLASLLVRERESERARIIKEIGKWKSDCKVYHNKHVDTADKIKGFNFALECVLTHLTEGK